MIEQYDPLKDVTSDGFKELPEKARNAAQTHFDHTYITASEIMKRLGVSRSTLHEARRKGKLGDPVAVHGQIFIWERKTATPYLNAWQTVLNASRRGVANAE